MKKTKRLLSMLTALAITASAFSAFVIPAHAAAQVYVNENFDSYEAGQIIKSVGYNQKAGEAEVPKPDDVPQGSIVYSAGVRNNGASNNSATIQAVNADDLTQGKQLYLYNDGAASGGRGIGMTFATSANIPEVSDIENTEVLELSMKVKSSQTFTVVGFGDIVPATDLTTDSAFVKARFILDKGSNKQYMLITDLEGNLLNTKIANLTATSFTKLEFYSNQSGKNTTIDDLKVEVKTKDTGVITFVAKDGDDANLNSVKIKIGDLEFTTGADSNTVEVALPNGTYSATASKDGYEHTEGLKDAHTVSDITVNSDTPTVNFVLSQMNYQKIPDTVNVTGGQSFVAAPKTATPNTTAAFTVEVIDQENVAMAADEYALEWAIYPAGTTETDPNVTIDQNGVVSVSQAFRANNNTAFYDVTAVADANGRSTKATATLCVGNSDIIYYEPVNWDVSARDDTKSFVSQVTLPQISDVYFTMKMSLSSETNAHKTWALEAGKESLVILQYQNDTGNIVVGTGWKGSGTRNQYSDDASDHAVLTESETLIENYTGGTEFEVHFVVNTSAKRITVSCGDTSVSLPYTIEATQITGMREDEYRQNSNITVKEITVREPDEDYLSIAGDDKLAKVYGATVTRDYTLGMSVIDPEETFSWTVAEAPQGAVDGAVTIENGKLSVRDTAIPGTYKITAASSKRPTTKKAEYSVYIGDFRADGDTDSDHNMEITLAGSYAIDPAALDEEEQPIITAIDASGEAIKVTSAKDQSAVLIQAAYDEGVLTGVKTDNVTLTKGDNTPAVAKLNGATKFMLWNSITGDEALKPLVGESSADADRYSVVSVKDTYEDDVTDVLPKAVWSSSDTSVAKVDASTGAVTIVGAGTTNITSTINNGTKQSGTAAVLTKTIPLTIGTYSITGEADGNSTTVDTTTLVQNADIAKYMVTTATSAGVKVNQTEVNKADLIKADYAVDTTGADKYEIAPIFEKSFDDMGTLGTYDAGYNFAAPADTYNFVLNTTGSRADIYATNQMLVNNIMQSGGSASMNVNDIVISDNVVNITGADYDLKNGHKSSDTKATVKFYKSPTIVNREKKMYVLGDSLVCIYYNGGSDSKVTLQTGWGQVIDKFVKNVEVVDLGNSGVTAKGLLGSAFTQVLESAQEGDIMILESGYNDRTYDTEEIMKSSVTEMVTKAKAKNVKVVLVSPNASQHDYKADVSWTAKMAAVAEATETDYIDLAALSYKFLYDRYGDDTETVKATFNVSDGLHSQYRAAVKYASIVAGQLLGFDGYTDIVDTNASYTYQDSKGNDFICKAEAPAPAGD